jgi:hypothetical protein
MSTERKRTGPKRQRQLVKGIPGGDCDSCVDWLLKNINKAKGRGARVGQIARDQFAIILDDCIRSLLDLALPLREKDTTTKEWAGRILAKLHVSLEAHKWKLERENPVYRDRKAKMGKTRANVLVPESEISQMVREELVNAEHYQFQLGILQEVSPNGWQDMAQRKGIPKVYWATPDLQRFCEEFADKWWDWLWSRILKDKEVLLPGRNLGKVRTQIRGYFLALVDARENGTF